MKKHAKATFAGRISLWAMASSDFQKIDLHDAQTLDPALDGLAEFDKFEAGDRSRYHQMSGLETAAMIPNKASEGAKNVERVSAGNSRNPFKDHLTRNFKSCGDTRKIHTHPIADRLPIDQAGIDLVVCEVPQGMSRFVIDESRINHLDCHDRRDALTNPVGEVDIGGIGKCTINPESHFEFDANQGKLGPGESCRAAADPISNDRRHDGSFIDSFSAGLEGSDRAESSGDGFLNPICRSKVDNRIFQVGAGQLPAAVMCGTQEVDSDSFGRTISHNVISSRLYRQAYAPVEPVSYLWQIYLRFGTVHRRIAVLPKLTVPRFVDSAKASGPVVPAENGLTIAALRFSKG